MIFQYLHTVDIDDDAFSIHILEIQMVIDLYSYIEDVDDDGLDDDVPTKPLPRVEFEHFRDNIGVVRKDLPERGSSDVAVALYHPWALSLK